MAKTIYYCATSLDGYIATADDSLDWLTGYEGSFEDPAAEPGPMSPGGAYERFYEGIGALVSGSVTYEWLLDHVEAAGGAWPYLDKPLWVLSSRELRTPGGESDVRVRSAPVRELHAELSAAAGDRAIWIVGGGGVASQFADAGVLDEVHITLVPAVLGAGKPLFDRPLPPGAMRLTGARTFENGMAELRYAVELTP